jgi:predicted transcriptional regulator
MTPSTRCFVRRGEPNRNLRVPDDLWDRALAVARTRGETLSAVIRAALVRYVKRHEKDGS